MLVCWTKHAADDLWHICGYTEKRFGAAQARRVALAIYESADSLKEMPYRGRKGRKPNTRELMISGLLPDYLSRRKGSGRDCPRPARGAAMAVTFEPAIIALH
jgi:plasmid stabilization system protein ParE